MAKRRSRGDGSVFYDEKRGMYVGQIGLGADENGKHKRKTVYGTTKAEVMEKLKSVEFQVYTGTFVDVSHITIYHLAKQILDDKLNQGEFQAPTYYRNIATLKLLKDIYNTPLQSANETQIRNCLLKLNTYSQSSINKAYNLISSTFTEAVKRKIISSNPMEYIKKPRTKKREQKVRALTTTEQKKLIDVLLTEDINYSRQMLLSMLTGMRMGEINALDVKSVNFKFNVITIKRTMSRGPKGEAVLNDTTKTTAGIRNIPMTEEVASILRDCIKSRKQGLIFLHNDKLINTNQVNCQFSRIVKKYDILDNSIDGKVDLHSLRHTYGTRCIEGGMSFKALQELMGHTDIRITMNTYCDATSDFINTNIERVNEYMKNVGLNLELPGTKKSISKNINMFHRQQLGNNKNIKGA